MFAQARFRLSWGPHLELSQRRPGNTPTQSQPAKPPLYIRQDLAVRPFRPYLLHGVSRERGLSAVDVVVHLDPEHRVEVEIEVGRSFAVEFPSYVDQQIDVEGLEADLVKPEVPLVALQFEFYVAREAELHVALQTEIIVPAQGGSRPRAWAEMKILLGVGESYVSLEWWVRWLAQMKCFPDRPPASGMEVLVTAEGIEIEAEIGNASWPHRVQEFACIPS